MSMQLKEAIKRAQTFIDLIPIAKQLKAKLSFWGRQYVIIEPNHGEVRLNYEGMVPLNALLNRILEIIHASGRDSWGIRLFKNSEHSECRQLEIEIIRFYLEDKELYNKSCIITKIAIVIRSIFHGNYQFEWNNDVWGRDQQILRRACHHVWDDNTCDYVFLDIKS